MTPQELAARLLARLKGASKESPEDLARRLKARQVPARQQAPSRRPKGQVFEPWIAFASGLKPGQIYGFAEIGRGVGFSLAERRDGVSVDLGTKAWKGYLDVLERMYDELPNGFRVLVDNGAVQEVDLETMTSVAPISDQSWKRRMDRYIELASQSSRALAREAPGWWPNGVWLITPDRIGDQQETIRRFTLCAPQLRETVRLGATLVLTLQPGELGPIELEARLRALLLGPQDRQIVPAFPMRLRGDDRRLTVTPMASLLAFVKQRRPHTVHLLGMGLKSKLLPGVLRQIHEASPGTKVTLDSADVRAVAVQGRPWIEEKPWAQSQVQRRVAYVQGGVHDIDDTEILFDLDQEGLRVAGERAGLNPECLERFVKDPEGVYGVIAGWDEDDEDHPCMESGLYDVRELDAALAEERFLREPKFPSSAGKSERDRLLVHRVFGPRRS